MPEPEISTAELYRGIQRIEATVAMLVTSDRYAADQRAMDERILAMKAEIADNRSDIESDRRDRKRMVQAIVFAVATAFVIPLILMLIQLSIQSGHTP